MCGISGWIDGERDLTYDTQVMERMSETMANRGPDASGLWMSRHAALAHRRLSVVDPAGGSQPMIRNGRHGACIITYNGELYNTGDLRRELILKGYGFTGTSDTEVLLTSYLEWEEECVERFNGIFAFGIWDEGRRRLFMARDRFGVKPLFYVLRGGSIIFASELKAMLAHPSVKPVVDAEGLAEIFALGPARTPGHGVFKDVHELPPAHCLVYDGGYADIKRYWSLVSQPHTDNIENTVETVKNLVLDSITRQFVSDVPVCTFLSGGLDSSAITALAAAHFKNSGQGCLHTYSIDYAGNERFFKSSSYQPDPDTPYVERMSNEFGTIHHHITVDTPQLVESLYDAVDAKDLPGMADVDSSLLLFCREIKKNATVALSGECADEVFGGYPWFHKAESLFCGTFPWSVNMDFRRSILSGELLYAIKPDQYAARRYAESIAGMPRLPGEDPVEEKRREMFWLNMNWFMSTLLDRKDRMSMATGLEVRVPYCDHRLVQYVWNIPWSMKMYGSREKGLLRTALKGVLPEEILLRRKSPYPKTHNPAYETSVKLRLADILDDAGSPLRSLVDIHALCRLMEQPSDYGKPWFGQLMAVPQLYAYLVQVDYWMRKYGVILA